MTAHAHRQTDRQRGMRSKTATKSNTNSYKAARKKTEIFKDTPNTLSVPRCVLRIHISIAGIS